MKKLKYLLLIFIAVLLLPCWVGAEYFCVDAGDTWNSASCSSDCATEIGADTCMDASDFNTSGNWDTDDADDNKIGQSDFVYISDTGGVIRTALVPQQSGASTKPITIANYSGDTPIISGADTVSTFTPYSGIEAPTEYCDMEEGDLTDWDSTVEDSGDLSAHADGAMAFTSVGMKAVIDDTTSIYGEEAVTWSSGRDFRVRFYFDPNGLSDGGGSDYFDIFFAEGSGQVRLKANVELTSGPTYKVQGVTIDDGAGWQGTAHYEITNGPHYIELHLIRSSADTVTDASVSLYIDGVLKETKDTFEHYTKSRIDTLRLGVIDLDAETSGTIYLDEMVANTAATTIGPKPAYVYNATLAGATEAFGVWEDNTTILTNETACDDIDAASEWYHDTTNNLLCVRDSDNTDPDTHTIEAGQRETAININGKDYITIDGLTLRHGSSALGGTLELINVDNITVQNSEISYGAARGILYTTDADNVVVTDSTFKYNGTDGIYAYKVAASSSNENYIKQSTFHNNGIFGIGVEGNYFIVEENLVYDNGNLNDLTAGIEIYNIDDDGYAQYNIVRYNKVYGQISDGDDGSGINIDNESQYSYVYGNVVYDNDGACIAVLDSHYSYIYNNTCYANQQDSGGEHGTISEIWAKAGSNGDTTYVVIKNNITFAVGANIKSIWIDAETVEQAGIDIANNIWYGNGYFYFWDSGSGDTLATWNALPGVGTDINSDPKMTNPGSQDFTLQSTSPAIDAGVNLGATYKRGLRAGYGITEGKLKNQGGLWDMGAYPFDWRGQGPIQPGR